MPKPHSRQWVTVDVFLLGGLMLAFVGFVGISHASYSRSNGDRGNSRGDGGGVGLVELMGKLHVGYQAMEISE